VLVPEKWNLVQTDKDGVEAGVAESDLDTSSDEEEEADPLEGEGRWCGL